MYKEFTIKNFDFRIGYDNLIDMTFGYNYNPSVDFCYEIVIGRLFICWTKGE